MAMSDGGRNHAKLVRQGLFMNDPKKGFGPIGDFLRNAIPATKTVQADGVLQVAMTCKACVGAVLIKKDEPEAGTPWRVLEVEDGIHLQRVGQPDNVWKGESIGDVNRAFTPENGDEMADYIPANVKSVADIGYTQVHLKALREHKADSNALPTFSGGAMTTLPTARQPQEPRIHVMELDATEVSAMAGIAEGVNAARSRPFSIVKTTEYPFKIDHELKIDPERLAEIIVGTKTHEIRVFDRGFQVGNTLKLNAYDRSTNTWAGQFAIVKVANITAPGSYGLPENVGAMSIALIDALDFRPEVSMADVLANSKPVYIDLGGAEIVSFAEGAAWVNAKLRGNEANPHSDDNEVPTDPKDFDTVCLSHKYDIGDQSVYVERIDSASADAKRAAAYVWWKCNEFFGDRKTLSNLGVAALLVQFYGYRHTARRAVCTQVDLYKDTEGKGCVTADDCLFRDGLREAMAPHLIDQ